MTCDDDEHVLARHRAIVVDYLAAQRVRHGEVAQEPAFDVLPYVSLWAIESGLAPGRLGWWVIAGDLPTDYVSARDASHPRAAVRAIARRWLEVAACMARGEPHPDTTIGAPQAWSELAPLLRSRAELLATWTEDGSLWEDE